MEAKAIGARLMVIELRNRVMYAQILIGSAKGVVQKDLPLSDKELPFF